MPPQNGIQLACCTGTSANQRLLSGRLKSAAAQPQAVRRADPQGAEGTHFRREDKHEIPETIRRLGW
jgi:hypothetical protein